MKKIFEIFVCMLFVVVCCSLSVTAEAEKDAGNVGSVTNGTIELDGTFAGAFHILYHKAIGKGNYGLGMSIIKFTNADININDGEFDECGSGVMFVFHYRGIYDHDIEEDTLSMNGRAWFVQVNMD